jgi:hypothetical protein
MRILGRCLADSTSPAPVGALAQRCLLAEILSTLSTIEPSPFQGKDEVVNILEGLIRRLSKGDLIDLTASNPASAFLESLLRTAIANVRLRTYILAQLLAKYWTVTATDVSPAHLSILSSYARLCEVTAAPQNSLLYNASVPGQVAALCSLLLSTYPAKSLDNLPIEGLSSLISCTLFLYPCASDDSRAKLRSYMEQMSRMSLFKKALNATVKNGICRELDWQSLSTLVLDCPWLSSRVLPLLYEASSTAASKRRLISCAESERLQLEWFRL